MTIEITDQQIHALRGEAEEHGDLAMVANTPKPKKNRNPKFIAAAAAARREAIEGQIKRLREKLAEKEAELEQVGADLDGEALEAYRRLVGE